MGCILRAESWGPQHLPMLASDYFSSSLGPKYLTLTPQHTPALLYLRVVPK